jgi:hypothetical protein
MKANTIYKIVYLLSFILITIGLLFKIHHWPYSSDILSVGLLFSIVYVFIGIQTVLSKKRIEISEKIMWVAGFTFVSTITGLMYMLSKRW